MDDGLLRELQDAIGDAYAIERELGGGGMSRVFLAMERSLGRRVVIKVLPPELVSGVSEARFQREIMVTANLQHPHSACAGRRDQQRASLLYHAQLEQLLSAPSLFSAAYLRRDSIWAPLKQLPRFQQLLAKGTTALP